MDGRVAAGTGSIAGDHSSILILRLSALGDVIHTIPAVVALRQALPRARMAWVVEAAYREFVEIVAGVEAVPLSMKRWGRNLIASRPEMAAARSALSGFETSVDFQGLVKSAALGFLSGARRRYGFDRAAIRETPALLFTNSRISVDRSQHVVDWNLALAGQVGGRTLSHPAVDYSRFAGAGPDGFSGSVALLPGAGKAFKQWPVERFRELARRLGDRAVVVWGPGEESLARAIAEGVEGCRIAPRTNLRELAHVLAGASMVVGGDTGPLHLASAMRTPVVGLYGPTSERRNGPYGQLQNCISTFETSKTMDSISVDEVMRKIEAGAR
ncbi:MAG: lipopolysaccharide heptosyltransferase I [Acidobacteriota bacterium]